MLCILKMSSHHQNHHQNHGRPSLKFTVPDFVLILTIALVYIQLTQGKSPFLPLLICFEIALSSLSTTILTNLSLYSFDNMPLILTVRMSLLLTAAYFVMRHRENKLWSIIGVVYSLVFLYNGLSLVEVGVSGLNIEYFFMSNYSLFMRVSLITLLTSVAPFNQKFIVSNHDTVSSLLMIDVHLLPF